MGTCESCQNCNLYIRTYVQYTHTHLIILTVYIFSSLTLIRCICYFVSIIQLCTYVCSLLYTCCFLYVVVVVVVVVCVVGGSVGTWTCANSVLFLVLRVISS